MIGFLRANEQKDIAKQLEFRIRDGKMSGDDDVKERYEGKIFDYMRYPETAEISYEEVVLDPDRAFMKAVAGVMNKYVLEAQLEQLGE